ncbi:MAG: hypothetical protein H5T99_07535 [Moorella sp. (in: Bacteria)]|nr:hypothetical protein [Moorella sp. (in: firmicutes)]
MLLPDCLGLTFLEARKILAAGGYQIINYTFTGPYVPPAGKEDTGRVVRLRLVGAGQVNLVLAYVDTHHQ